MENALLSMEVMLVTLGTCICHYATRFVVQCERSRKKILDFMDSYDLVDVY